MVDYKRFDLDAPVPQELGNGETTTAKAWLEGSCELTLRDLAEGPSNSGMEFIGSADTMAGQMAEVMEEAGGDGFLIYPEVARRSIMEVCDGLAPALRRRGAIRDGYAFPTFRENLPFLLNEHRGAGDVARPPVQPPRSHREQRRSADRAADRCTRRARRSPRALRRPVDGDRVTTRPSRCSTSPD